MSNSFEEERKRDITPKPRPSIHSDIMGKYGLVNPNTRKHDLSSRSDQMSQGTDEVDNIISKPMRQQSPLVTKKHIQRSFSHSDDNEFSDDDEDDDGESDVDNEESYTHTRSTLEGSRRQYSRRNSTDSQFSPSHKRSPYVSESIPRDSNKKIYIIITLFVLGIALAVGLSPLELATNFHNKATQTENYDVIFEHNMDNLKEKYNIDDNSILKIKTGISTIFSRMDAGSFVFLYNSETYNFDPTRFNKFINEVALTAAKYLRNDIKSIDHTVVESSSLNMQEHEELIRKYRDDVEKTGVMLVPEIDSVPSDLAMAFHYYCDEYDPLVKRSAIFFTLNLANCSRFSDIKSNHDFVEKCLAQKWKTVPPENIRPLLTRIVDIIIDVTKVF